MTETINNRSDICRTCLKQSYTLMSLNQRLYDNCTLTIANTITKCLSIQLTNRNECNNICLDCVAKVKQTQNFYERCLNSERIFGSYVTLTDIKQEPNEIKSQIERECDGSLIECGLNIDETHVKVFKNEVVDNLTVDVKRTPKRYCCNYCNETFTVNELIRDHLHKKHNVCHLCYIRLESKEQLAEHISNCTCKYKCNVCDQTYVLPHKCRQHFMKCRENYLQTLKSRNEPYSAVVNERLKCIDEQYKRFVDVEQSNNVVCLICDTIVPKKSFRLHLQRDHEDNNGELTCRLCHRKLPHYIYVKKHMERMHGDVNNVILNGGHFDLVQHFRVTFENKRKLTHKCVDCTETYDLKRDLTRHRRQTHKACPGCDKSFKKRAEFMKHRLVCVALECEICHAKFKTHAQTNKHFLECAKTYLNGNVNDVNEKRIREKFESVSKSQMKRCAVCEENVAIKAGQPHRQKHLDDFGYFKCAKCELTSDNYQTLYGHYQAQHQKSTTSRNLRSARILTCHLCLPPSTFASFRDFRKHIAHNHADENGRIACNVCTKTYSSYRRTEAHLTVKHNVVIESKRPRDLKRVRDTPKDGFVCPYCGLSLKAQRNLLFHIRYKHTKERPEVCEMCSATFVSRGEMRKHVHLKHTEKNLQCDECEKKFSYPYFLSQHKRGCHREGNHTCQVCNKVYRTKSSLQSHVKSHGERTFVCKYCDKSFYCNRHLRRHTYIHTGEKPVVCKFCPEAFVQHTSRKLHEQRYHKNELMVKMENRD